MFLMGFREENAKKLEGVTTRETHVWSRRYARGGMSCRTTVYFWMAVSFEHFFYSTSVECKKGALAKKYSAGWTKIEGRPFIFVVF